MLLCVRCSLYCWNVLVVTQLTRWLKHCHYLLFFISLLNSLSWIFATQIKLLSLLIVSFSVFFFFLNLCSCLVFIASINHIQNALKSQRSFDDLSQWFDVILLLDWNFYLFEIKKKFVERFSLNPLQIWNWKKISNTNLMTTITIFGYWLAAWLSLNSPLIAFSFHAA